MGWDNNVHVPVHTQARQQAVVFHHQLLLGWGGVGWGGVGWGGVGLTKRINNPNYHAQGLP